MINLDNLGWGGFMMLAGMGTVFLLLLLLMAVLLLIGQLDRAGGRKAKAPAVEAAPAPVAELEAEPSGFVPAVEAPSVQILHDGLTREQIAAVTIAVITHARVRRAQAAPAMRSHQPGSHLYASRWVSVGRGQQNSTWRRN